jgi:hypothetical protein
MFAMRRIVGCLFFLSFFSVLANAGAIEIDDFDSAPEILTAPAGGQSSSVGSASALSGSRSLFLRHLSGGGAVSLVISTTDSSIALDQGVTSRGGALVVWDGTGIIRLNLDEVATGALSPVNLTEGDADAFRIVVDSKDLPELVTLKLHVFEHGSPAAARASLDYALDFSIPLGGEPVVLDIPFASLSPAIDFTQVGAIAMELIGETPLVDLSIGWFGTNGNCPSVPFIDTGSVLDSCGQCPADLGYVAPDGPLKSCLDCSMVPFGEELPGTQCSSGFPGQCEQGIVNEFCACTPGSPSIEICDGADNNCSGQIDENFPQLGLSCGVDLPNCQIQGIFVCSGDGGIRCEADFDPSEFEQCGLIIGCDGIPGSDLRFDACGICGGDGSSCVGCDSVDIFGLLVQLDGNAKAQEQLVKRIANRVAKRVGTQGALERAQESRRTANELQIRNWVLSWTIPSVQVTCPETAENCILVESTSTTAEYIENSIELRITALNLARRLRASTGNTNSFKVYRRRATRLHKKSIKLTGEVPVSTQRCF